MSGRFTDYTRKGKLDFRYADSYGLPFEGDVPLATETELESLTVRKATVGYGTFNTAVEGHKQNGRTLSQVYNLAAAGVFRIVHEEHRWEESDEIDDNSGLRSKMVVFVVWQELAQTTKKAYWQNVKETFGSVGI